jgi:hypothetical protein
MNRLRMNFCVLQILVVLVFDSSNIAHSTFYQQSISTKCPWEIGDAVLIANLNERKEEEIQCKKTSIN